MAYLDPKKILVPAADGADNAYVQDVVGNRTDKSFSSLDANPTLLGHARANYYHVHDRARAWPSGYGAVSAESVSAGGTGYAVGNTLTASGGTGATFEVATIDTGGEVLTVTRITDGTGYIGGVTATTGGDGTGCTLDLTTDYFYGKDAITLTAGASAWLHGTKVEIVAVNAIASVFDIHWLVIANVSHVDDYELRLFTGASGETEIGRECFARNAATDRASAYIPTQGPPLAANSRVMASVACSAATESTCELKIFYHTYPDVV